MDYLSAAIPYVKKCPANGRKQVQTASHSLQRMSYRPQLSVKNFTDSYSFCRLRSRNSICHHVSQIFIVEASTNSAWEEDVLPQPASFLEDADIAE